MSFGKGLLKYYVFFCLFCLPNNSLEKCLYEAPAKYKNFPDPPKLIPAKFKNLH